MEPTTLTKSRFKVALECPRKLVYAADRRYVNAKSEDELLEALAEGGHQVGALAKLMYPGGIEISAASIEDQVRATERLLQEEEITLFEPTFRHRNLVVRVDVLVKCGREVQLIEVKAKGCNPANSFGSKKHSVASEWRPYLYDVAFQTLVLERTHPEWEVVPFLMLLNTSARVTADGVGAQFRIERNGRRVHVTVREGFDPAILRMQLLWAHDVTEEVRILRSQLVDTPAGSHVFEELIDRLGAETAAGRELPPYPGSQCKRCEFYCAPAEVTEDNRSGWAECMEKAFHRRVEWPRTATVFGLYNYRKLEVLLGLKRLALTDINENDLDINEVPGEISPSHRHGLQIEEAKSTGKEVHLERDTLRRAFGKWPFPLHFIDFETSRPALPFHAGHRPHELLLFQFSHHVLEKDGRLRHADQCLVADPGIPPSIAVVRAVRSALSGDSGTVVHWWDHERTVLKEIRKQISASCEDDREELVAFIDTLIGNGTVSGRLADLGRLVADVHNTQLSPCKY